MLDTRSGRLLTSQSFTQTFSQLKSVPGGITYFLHQYDRDQQEIVELYYHDLTANVSRLVTSFIHHPRRDKRPPQWHASLSPDGALLAYQQDTLQPVITVASGQTGEVISTIRWEGDLTALPISFDSQNEYLAVPLANWNAAFRYGSEYKLLVAKPKTGQVVGVFDLPHYISQVYFHAEGMTLMTEHQLIVGRVKYDSPVIEWTNHAKDLPANTHMQLFRQDILAGYITRPGGSEAVQFHYLSLVTGDSTPRFQTDKGYLPIGLRGNMLVSEKSITRELPSWLQKLNERVHSIARRYLIAPQVNTVRFQDAQTGEICREMQFPFRNVDEYLTRRIAGTNIMAVVFKQDDHLGIEFYDIFPFWTDGKLTMLSLMITLLVYLLFRFVNSRTRGKRSRGIIMHQCHRFITEAGW